MRTLQAGLAIAGIVAVMVIGAVVMGIRCAYGRALVAYDTARAGAK